MEFGSNFNTTQQPLDEEIEIWNDEVLEENQQAQMKQLVDYQFK